MARTGRPTSYTKAKAQTICEMLAEGRTLTALCEEPGMPSTMSVYRWLATNPDFRDAYVRARSCGYDIRAEQIIDQARRSDDPQKARLVFDAERWYLSKMMPRKYGDRSTVELTDPEGGGPRDWFKSIYSAAEGVNGLIKPKS